MFPAEQSLFNIYVADNGDCEESKLGLAGLMHAIPPRPLTAVFNTNIGYARACNQLAAMGNSDYIGLCNADIWMTQKDIEKIVESFEENPDAAIIGPKQRDENGYVRAGPIVWNGERLHHTDWNRHDPQDILLRDKTYCATVSGSAYFIRRTVWNALSNCLIYKEVDPGSEGAMLQTNHFFEETFLSMHATHHGYKILFDGSISIGHSWRASTGPSPILSKYFTINKEIYRKACDFEGIRHEVLD